ncbi:MAG TPA: response regulator [Acidobacteria bacterium]|nr:response regulator [Acidobacteriota bacterium]
MATPVIFTVDDEPPVLNAVERDLRSHYGREYRIAKAGSGAEALDAVNRFKQRGTPVAMFVVDQRMPEMTGTEFLEKAAKVYPDAKKVLLTAYADTEAAITCINTLGLDRYLMKPWDPPERELYPALDDLLSDWQASVPAAYDGIRVVGTLWSAHSHRVKDFLARNCIPYRWLDVEAEEEARTLVRTAPEVEHSLPGVFFPDGKVLAQPSNIELAEAVGLQTQATKPFFDMIIVGGGPAGLGAAVYGASEGLRTALIEREATGGQAGTSARIENYLGFPKGLSGSDLARRATDQARRFGVEILTAQEAVKVRVEDPYRIVELSDGSELRCHALVVATGVSIKTLDAPGVDEFAGAGVYYGAAVTEAAHYKNLPVVVVGGANSAGQGAVFFSQYASKVTMLVRSDLSKSMSQYLIDQIDSTENIEVLSQTELAAVEGNGRIDGVRIVNNQTSEEHTIPAAAVFIFVGAVPHTELVSDVIQTSDKGFIITGGGLMKNGKRPTGWKLDRDPYLLETSVPGIFAAGDVRDDVVRRVASAVGQGSIAVSFVHQYLKTV